MKWEKFLPLQGRRVILFPDLKGFGKWSEKAEELRRKLRLDISVSDFLENNANATDEQIEKGLDLEDFLVVRDPKFGWALTGEGGYPVFWDYAKRLINASKVVVNLTSTRIPVLPKNEAEARPLSKLPPEEQQSVNLQRMIKKNPKVQLGVIDNQNY